MSQRQVDPVAVNIANFLKDHKQLKQRQGSLQGNTVEFFRFKRAQRLLLSEEYKTKSENPKNQLPPITNDDQAKSLFAHLIKNQLLLPGQKLHTQEAREKNLNPKKGTPVFLLKQNAELTPDEYYVWFYKKTNPWDLVKGFGIVAAIFTLILFPLWPFFMRKGVWYLSMGCLFLIALFFVIAIIRLIIFSITYVALKPGLWIFPNLFEDCGFFESFVPLYGWHESESEKKAKKKAAKAAKKASTATSVSTASSKIENVNSTTTSSSKANESTTTKRKVTLEEVDE